MQKREKLIDAVARMGAVIELARATAVSPEDAGRRVLESLGWADGVPPDEPVLTRTPANDAQLGAERAYQIAKTISKTAQEMMPRC
jgi:hypothetical protein